MAAPTNCPRCGNTKGWWFSSSRYGRQLATCGDCRLVIDCQTGTEWQVGLGQKAPIDETRRGGGCPHSGG